jgi:hypothetical protein
MVPEACCFSTLSACYGTKLYSYFQDQSSIEKNTSTKLVTWNSSEQVLMQGSKYQISNFEWFGKNRHGRCFYIVKFGPDGDDEQ